MRDAGKASPFAERWAPIHPELCGLWRYGDHDRPPYVQLWSPPTAWRSQASPERRHSLSATTNVLTSRFSGHASRATQRPQSATSGHGHVPLLREDPALIAALRAAGPTPAEAVAARELSRAARDASCCRGCGLDCLRDPDSSGCPEQDLAAAAFTAASTGAGREPTCRLSASSVSCQFTINSWRLRRGRRVAIDVPYPLLREQNLEEHR